MKGLASTQSPYDLCALGMASLDKYKLHNNTWDSDTNPSGFWEFMFLMSATVRAIKWGSILEDYIDVKLGRVQQHAVMTPSFITDDPDFDMPSTQGACRPKVRRHPRVTQAQREDLLWQHLRM